MSKQLDKAIKDQDLHLVRSVIVGTINTDRNLQEFRFLDKADYAAEKLQNVGIQLYEEDDGQLELAEDKSGWTEDLWRRGKVVVQENFSRKKLELISTLMKHLRQKGHVKFQVEENNFTRGQSKDGQEPGRRRQKIEVLQHNTSTSAQTLLFISIGAITGLVVGAMTVGKIVGTIVGAAVGYGGEQILKRNQGSKQ